MTNGPKWERPNPARLNDTSAIVRKGTYNYGLKTSAYCNNEPCETPFIPENTFNRKALPMAEVCGPFGSGILVTSRTAYNQRNGRTPDGNGTVPGNRGTLSVGVEQINKSGSGR
jgi:hypothetical protein